MKTKRAYLVVFGAMVAVTLVTSCVPRGAVVNTGGADIGVIDRSDSAGANRAVIVDRAPHATRTPMSLALPTLSLEPTPASADTPAELGSGDVSGVEQPADAASPPVNHESAVATITEAVALTRVEDVDPAPPFVVRVDSVRLVDGGETYKVTGWIHNDGAVTYEGIGLEATFYDGSDWHFGPFDATCACYSLAPGQSCAFSVEAYARDYTGYRLHPEGSQLKAWTGSPTVLTVTDAVVAGIEAGHVRLTGVVQNQTGSTVNAVRVSAALMDSRGAVTGVGSIIVAGQLGPGAEAFFSLRIPASLYASYAVMAEAELQ